MELASNPWAMRNMLESEKDNSPVKGGKMSAGAQLPLAMVEEGTTVEVSRIGGTSELRQHLAELGFVAGAEVKVVSRAASGLIVSVKGATFAIDTSMARRIATR